MSDIERSEGRGSIRLDTLARAAEAMGCDLVYALIPRGSLTEIVQRKAREKVGEQTRAVSRAMDLGRTWMSPRLRGSGWWNPEHGDVEIPDGWEHLPSGDAFLTEP